MNTYPALLYDFFQRLRQIGLSLSVDQYELFLRGYILSDIKTKEDLLLFCKTVWLTRPSFREDFERLFEEYYQKIPNPFAQTPQIETGITTNQPTASPDPAPTPTPTPTSTPSLPPSANQTTETLPQVDYEKNEVSLQIRESEEGNIQEGNRSPAASAKAVTFLFTEQKHLPFTARKTQQLLRKLRTPTERRTTDELDIPKLSVRVAKEQFIQQLDFQQKQYGIQRIVWLSDHGGSMMPFEAWERQLTQLVIETPSVKTVELYFFHDYPTLKEEDFTFFTNRTHTQVKMASQLLKKADPKTIFLIFSDGGSAHKPLDTERLSVFFKLVDTLKKHKVRMAWLNPARTGAGGVTGYLSSLITVKYPDNDQLKRLIAGL